jgi:hypothetical protein
MIKGLVERLRQKVDSLQEKDDRCTRIAKRKYDAWPSAYASGAVVRCRRGEIWKDLKDVDLPQRNAKATKEEATIFKKKRKLKKLNTITFTLAMQLMTTEMLLTLCLSSGMMLS